MAGACGFENIDHLTYNQLFRRYEGKLKYDYELHGPLLATVQNFFNEGRPVRLSDFSPYHRLIYSIKESQECVNELDAVEARNAARIKKAQELKRQRELENGISGSD